MTFHEINFDPRFIDVCVDSLLNLKKQNERYDPDEVWCSGILSRLNHLEHWSEDIHLLVEAKNTLRSFAGVKNVLEHLLESLENMTKTVAKALLPFQRGRGLASLPDDVLSMIFVYVGSNSRLNLVCRRFRQVAYALPQLWNYISNSMKSMRLVNASLEKSKAVGLEVDLQLDPGYWKQLDVLQVLDAAVVHVDRWEKLSVSYPGESSWQEIEPCITQMGERTKNIHMPRLRTLSLDFDSILSEDVGLFDETESALHFYRTWSLPSLRHLQVEGSVPVPFATLSLTSLSIDLRAIDPDDERRHTLLRLFHFLSSVPYLEVLKLVLGRLVEDSNLPSIVLYHLKTLRMHCILQSEPPVFLIAKALATPAIRSMHLSVMDESYLGLDTNVDMERWLDNLFCHDTYLTLEEFTFECFDEGYCRTFNIPFTRLPNLRTLILHTGEWVPSENLTSPGPPLRSLHLKGRVDNRWTYWLRNVWETMQERGSSTDVQDLTIEVKGSLNKTEIERLFSVNRVVWR